MQTWHKIALALLCTVVMVVLWAYLGGGILLASQKQDFNAATPLTMYQYWYWYKNDASLMKWIYISGGSSAGLLLSPILLFLKKDKLSLYGEARFAKKEEIEEAGLFCDKGIICGQYKGRYMMFGGSQHVMISAPTRSGKGVGVVIPTLLTWGESIVVLDIKQENWDLTSGYRARHGQECFLFNPAARDYKTHRYNPLHYISSNPHFRIDDIQKIANMLFPDQPGTDTIWTATPRSLFIGMVLYLLETPGKLVTLGQVLRESLAEGDGVKYFKAIIKKRAKSANPLSDDCVRSLNAYLTIDADNTRSGIITGFRSKLEVWANPLVDAATSGNDFDLRELRTKKMSVYIGVTPDNLERLQPLLNLFFQQLIDVNTQELPERRKVKRVNPDGTVDMPLKYKCVLLMDEFTAIGKMGVLSKGISYIAGYGLRMMPIIQSPAQLDETYGKDAAKTFTSNQGMQLVFPPKATELETAKNISEWLGYNTVDGVSVSKAKGLFAKKTPSQSVSDQRRALLLPQEVTSMKKGTQIVVVEDLRPIIANKIRYYNDHAFLDRLKSISPSLAKLGKKKPTQDQIEDIKLTGELSAPAPSIDVDKHILTVKGDKHMKEVLNQLEADETVIVERPITVEDIINIDSMALKNFAVDFSNVPQLSANGTNPDNTTDLDIDALNAYADECCIAAGIKLAA